MLPAISDTHPAAEKVQIDALRIMSPERKMDTLVGMIEVGHTLAMAGLRMRFPQAGPEELRRRLASLLLGFELAARVYGPEPPFSRP